MLRAISRPRQTRTAATRTSGLSTRSKPKPPWSTSALRTLKHGDAFAVLDSSGDIGTIAGTAEGLFYRDTRCLSHYELRIEEGKKPLLLSSSMHEGQVCAFGSSDQPGHPLGRA